MNEPTIFKPGIAEITNLVEPYKTLIINGVGDIEGYKKVHEARMVLQKTRKEITDFGAEKRKEAVAFQKQVIKDEKQLLSIIGPIEEDLKTMKKAIDEEKEKEKRRALLPERIEKLKLIDVTSEESLLLAMDNAQFNEYYNQLHAEFLRAKEAEIKAQQEKEAEERRIEEKEKEAEIQAKQDKIDEQKREQDEAAAKKEAELQAKEDALKAEEQRIKDEAIAAEQKIKRDAEEKKRVEEAEERARTEERERIEAEEKAKQAQEAKDKAEREKELKYQEFLKGHGYTEETKNEFFMVDTHNKTVLYKKVGELTID